MKLITALVFALLSALAQAQNFGQLFGNTQTPTGYYNPVGADATRNGCSDFLIRDQANGGCYPTPKYHLGQDMLVNTPTAYSRPGIGHQVYAIADGEIMYVSKDVSWGFTACDIVKSVLPRYDPACNSGDNLVNVAVFVKHRTNNGDFLAIYAHVLDYNLVTKQPFENTDSKVLNGAIHTILRKDQAFAVLGNYPAGPHLHFGIYPSFDSNHPSYPSGNKGLGYDLDAVLYHLVKSIPQPCNGCSDPLIPTVVGGVPKTFGLVDPVQWLTTTTPVNYISDAQQQVNQIGVPSSLNIPLGGVSIVPWQVSSLQGFSGTIQGGVIAESDATNSNLKIRGVMSQPQTLNSQQTINIQSLMYVPSTLTAQTYTTDVRTVSIDGVGNFGSTPTAQLALQVFQPSNTTQTNAPVINNVATSGITAVNFGTTFTIYIVGSSIDPGSVQALLNGPGCSTTCGATNVDVTNNSYVGTFVTPTQSGTYQLQLKNANTGAISAQYPITIYPALSVSCSASARSVPVNTPVTFTASVSGGLAPYSYNWDGKDFGTGSQLTTSFSNGGYLAGYTLNVTDSIGDQASGTCGLGIDVGQPAIISFTPSITPFAGASFNAVILGNNFAEDGTLDVMFCQSPSFTNCFELASSNIAAISDTGGSMAQVNNINLSAGNWIVKVRNGTGTWSNNSQTFTVATATAPELTASATISPASPSVGSPATITVQTENSGLAASGVIVDAEVYNSAGTRVYQQAFENQNFPQNTINSYTVNWTPTTLDTYTVKLGMFSAGWANQYSWNDSAVTFDVVANTAIPLFSSTATISPASSAAGQTLTTNVIVTNSGIAVSAVIVDIETYNSAGTMVDQHVFNNQSFAQSSSMPFSFTRVPNTPDTYKVKVGIFSSGWASQYNWNDNAATYVVSNATTPIFSSTASSSPSALAAGQTVTITATVADGGTSATAVVVDIETYNSAGTQVNQQVYNNQNFAQGGSLTYSFNFAPTLQDTYKVKIGVFTSGWASLYNWNDNASTYVVSGTASYSAGCTITPNPINLGDGATVSAASIGGTAPFTFVINGANMGSSNSQFIQPTQAGVNTSTVTVSDSAGHSASGNCSVQVNSVPPAITGYAWTPSVPTAGQNFSGTISGSGFVSGAQVFFCMTGTNTCFQHPAAGVFVGGFNQVNVINVNLSHGSWQTFVSTANGVSNRSSAFTVQ